MKTIGLLGGLTYISTVDYYNRINQKVKAVLGGDNSAQIILNSINYHKIKQYNYQDWLAVADVLERELIKLDSFQVDAILMCNNTLHKAYGLIEISVPYFHIIDAVGEEAIKSKHQKLLLLGTKLTMTDGFYQNKLKHDFQLETIIPNDEDVEEVNRIIQKELTYGKILESSREKLIQIMHKNSCDAVVLGCTELPLLLQQKHIDLPILDTVELHCNKAVDFILS